MIASPERTEPAPDLAPVGTTGTRPPGRAIAVIQAWLGPLDRLKILDVGCGGGQLAQRLAEAGADVVGIDPQEEAVAVARRSVPAARFEAARAEALPFGDDSFDAVLFHNSLHHVPGPAMADALKEGARVSRGLMLVIEPLGQGPFFETMRPVEDEGAIRVAAQAAISAALSDGALRLLRSGEYEDERAFPDLDAFLARVISVDPARAGQIETARAEVAALFARWGVAINGGLYRFNQPHRAHLLTA